MFCRFFLRVDVWKPDENRTRKDAFEAVVEAHFLGGGYLPGPASVGRES